MPFSGSRLNNFLLEFFSSPRCLFHQRSWFHHRVSNCTTSRHRESNLESRVLVLPQRFFKVDCVVIFIRYNCQYYHFNNWNGLHQGINYIIDANPWGERCERQSLDILIQQFPNAGVSKFVSQVYADEKNNFSAEVFFKEGPGSLQSVFGSERRYWNEQMKNALGLALGFPFQLSPRQNKTLCQQRCQSLLWISRDNLIGACRVFRVNCRWSRVNRGGSRKLSRVRKIELLLFLSFP